MFCFGISTIAYHAGSNLIGYHGLLANVLQHWSGHTNRKNFTMTNSFLDDDAYQTQMAGPWDGNSDYAPTPGIYGRTPATLYSPSPAPDCATDQPQPDHLNFLPLAEWQEGGEYDEMPPRYICYTIAWKLILNRKTVGKVTEEDLVIAPSEYWGKSLQANVENMLQTKKKRYQRVRSEGTAVTVKVDERSQKKLEKFCNSTNIDWAPVEKQLRKWSNLLRIGRKVTIELAFTYREDDDAHSMPSSRRVEKRGRVSATSRMLAEREAHIVAEEEATGQPSTWEYVYRLMGCDVRSCPHKSDWCWEDPKDKKHYKLRGPHLERLIDYVDEGGILDGHDDVPSDIRRDLVLESQTGRKSKKADTSTLSRNHQYRLKCSGSAKSSGSVVPLSLVAHLQQLLEGICCSNAYTFELSHVSGRACFV